jgi:small subunit ribosomal protein S6
MPRPYEVVYIFDSTLEEGQVNERLQRFHDLLKTPEHPEPVTALHHWGKRTLAYPIKRKETGYYVVAQFETAPTVLGEFERALKLDESLLRHLIVLNERVAAPAPAGVPAPEGDRDLEEDEE